MRRRGHMALLVMAAIAAAVVSFGAMAVRLSVGISARGPADVRDQALWLGRSALAAKVVGTREVATPEGKATVEVVKGTATVRLAGGVAVVSQTEERYDRGVTVPTRRGTP